MWMSKKQATGFFFLFFYHFTQNKAEIRLGGRGLEGKGIKTENMEE